MPKPKYKNKINSDIIYNFMLTEFPESIKMLKNNEESYRINSIFIPDTKRHLNIFIKGGDYIDYKSGEKGSFWWFVKNYKNLKMGERGVKDYLIKKYRKIDDNTAKDLKERIKTIVDRNEESQEIINCKRIELQKEFRFLNKKTEHSEKFFKYLYERGIDGNKIKRFKFCYAISGKYKNRVILPIFDSGDFVYFMARDITDTSSKKYLNPTREEVLGNGTGRLLFNYDFLREGDTSVVTEGTFNCLHNVKKNYVLNAVFGKIIGAQQLEKLKKKKVKKIILAYDNDKYFKDSILKSYNFIVRKSDIPCEVIDWDKYKWVFDEKKNKERPPKDFGELYKVYKELPLYTSSYRDYIVNKALGG